MVAVRRLFDSLENRDASLEALLQLLLLRTTLNGILHAKADACVIIYRALALFPLLTYLLV